MQPNTSRAPEAEPLRPIIRPRDQASLLVLIASLLILMGSWWLYRGGHQGKLIDVDRADPRSIAFQVDINRADWPELIQLPGLGETLAKRIVAERHHAGEFRELEELVRVNGIGPRTMERIRPYLLPIPADTNWAAVELDEEQQMQ